MTEPLADTWHSRDLPVLRTVVRLYDETMRPVRVGTVEDETGLDGQDVQRAAVALGAAGLVETSGRSQVRVLLFGGVTAEARQLAGAWPTAATATDRLITALEQIAANTDDADERTRLQQFACFLKSSGQQVGLSLATAVLTGQVT